MHAKQPLLTVILLVSLCAGAALPTDKISGVVRDSGNLAPIAGAIVTLQATEFRTTTTADGSYELFVPGGTQLVIVGANTGYFNRSANVDSPATGVDLLLDPVPQDHNLSYEFLGSSGCSFCHFETILDWEGTPMAKAGTNTWVADIFSGTGTDGGMGGFVYQRDSVHAAGNPESECAACHQPELWIENGYSGALDDNLGQLPDGAAHGISCEVCHKIAAVDFERSVALELAEVTDVFTLVTDRE